MKIDVENDNGISTLANVVRVNFEISIVLTLFNAVNSNVDVQNVALTMI